MTCCLPALVSPGGKEAAAEESSGMHQVTRICWMEHPHDQQLRIERDRDEILAQRSDLRRQQRQLNFETQMTCLATAQAAAMAERLAPTVYEHRTGERQYAATAHHDGDSRDALCLHVPHQWRKMLRRPLPHP